VYYNIDGIEDERDPQSITPPALICASALLNWLFNDSNMKVLSTTLHPQDIVPCNWLDYSERLDCVGQSTDWPGI